MLCWGTIESNRTWENEFGALSSDKGHSKQISIQILPFRLTISYNTSNLQEPTTLTPNQSSDNSFWHSNFPVCVTMFTLHTTISDDYYVHVWCIHYPWVCVSMRQWAGREEQCVSVSQWAVLEQCVSVNSSKVRCDRVGCDSWISECDLMCV